MPDLTPEFQIVAAKLTGLQRSTGNEHYWATDCERTIFQNSGAPNCVVGTPGLEARYAASGAEIYYHHSHPDERALSPSDLDLLTRDGVIQVWAHTPEGGSYGSELKAGVTRANFRKALNDLRGFMCAEILRLDCLPTLTDEDFEQFRDLAALEAFEMATLIDVHVRLSDKMRRMILPKSDLHIRMREYFHSKL